MTFATFYCDYQNREPFPWMGRLAERFVERDLPDVIDLPTGSGKSDLVFVWAWARQHNSRLPRRLWMVSDRRVIVDQTFEAAQRLRSDHLLVSRLRGGIVSDDDDLLDPVVQQIITSTVDQFGSRLLFRAYGSSPRAWPIWAGLAGNDTLVVLDETHLSPVAEETLRACQRLGANIHVISMTATPRFATGRRFALDDEDRNHPELGRRLRTKRIVELRDKGSLAGAGHELLESGCRKVAVICNTVRVARQTFDAIVHPDKHLLIGRQRPLDRDALLDGLLPRLKSGPDMEPLVVVATQCIEAGADFDFDGMVSAACPIDALRQRLGRLDRLGNRGEARCILVKPEDAKDVPPYGAAPVATWRWLQSHAKKKLIDLGADGWGAIKEFVPAEARSSRPETISLLEPHLRMLTRTSPRPRVEPDVDLLLHGRNRAPGAVQLIWRQDSELDSADLEATNEILEILPPSSLEVCEVPLWEVRAWLSGQTPRTDSGDVEGGEAPEPQRNGESTERVLRWEGREDGVSLVSLQGLRPGDTILLSSNRGGYDRFGWNPESGGAVPDLAAEAYQKRTGRSVVRYTDPDKEVEGDRIRIHRWTKGVVVETFGEEQRSRRSTTEVRLAKHSQTVANRARDDAQALKLDDSILYSAGLHHDDGKADTRWQLCVNGGNLARLSEPPLAKGNYVRSPLSRLPVGWRHEAESLGRLSEETSDLVRWLVATHHGYARPFWPILEHGRGFAELMDRLNSAHGYWGLALHETVLRCADRAVSKEETDNV
jgi:CRISPR-associated endonuclease/helicase Cas3